MNRQQNNNGGFTLIELLVVIGIIGLLTGLVTVNLQDARERARDAQRKADMRQIQNALELYKNDQNPQTFPETDDWQDEIVNGEYMKQVPQDPLNKQLGDSLWTDYTYTRNPSDTLQYTLIGCLENTADLDRDTAKGEDNECTYGESYTLVEP